MADSLSFLYSKDFLVGLFTGGGLAAIWKWVAGWNLINLSLMVENRRAPGEPTGTDNLVSLLRLKKGDRATLVLESIRFSVISNDREICNCTIEETKLSEVPRSLNMTPGEETQFAHHCRVSCHAVCKVTVTVIGRSLRNKCAPQSVWKATAISMPETKPVDNVVP